MNETENYVEKKYRELRDANTVVDSYAASPAKSKEMMSSRRFEQRMNRSQEMTARDFHDDMDCEEKMKKI